MWEGGWKNIPQLQKDNFFKFFKNNTRIKPLMTVKQDFFIFFYLIGVKQEVCFLWLKKARNWVNVV